MPRKHCVEFYVFSTGTTITISIFFNTHSYLQPCFLILSAFFFVGIFQSLHFSPSYCCSCLPGFFSLFLSYINQGHFFLFLITVIFFPLPSFQGTLALGGSAWVFCMPFSAIYDNDADFYKLYMAYGTRRILLHGFYGFPLNLRHLLQEYLNTTEKNRDGHLT